jgi:GntR family transcriptional repressor for pyruvate dehydrogenase complex
MQSIQKSSTPELVVREILHSIKSGEMKPGQKLPPERELAKILGVGRSSVREAISAMVLVGYFDVTQGKGIFLKKDIPTPYVFSSQLSDVLEAFWIFDLIEVREIMECNIVQLATERAGEKDIGKLNGYILDMENYSEDINNFYDADFEFHIALAEATKNEVMPELLKLIVEKAHNHYTKFLPDTLCRPDHAIKTAREIVASIQERDFEKSTAKMREHLRIVQTELKRIMPEVYNQKSSKKNLLY